MHKCEQQPTRLVVDVSWLASRAGQSSSFHILIQRSCHWGNLSTRAHLKWPPEMTGKLTPTLWFQSMLFRNVLRQDCNSLERLRLMDEQCVHVQLCNTQCNTNTFGLNSRADEGTWQLRWSLPKSYVFKHLPLLGEVLFILEMWQISLPLSCLHFPPPPYSLDKQTIWLTQMVPVPGLSINHTYYYPLSLEHSCSPLLH